MIMATVCLGKLVEASLIQFKLRRLSWYTEILYQASNAVVIVRYDSEQQLSGIAVDRTDLQVLSGQSGFLLLAALQ